MALNRYNEADTLLKRSLVKAKSILNPGHPLTHQCMVCVTTTTSTSTTTTTITTSTSTTTAATTNSYIYSTIWQ